MVCCPGAVVSCPGAHDWSVLPELYPLLCLPGGFELLGLRAAVLSEHRQWECCPGREELDKARPWELARLWETGSRDSV